MHFSDGYLEMVRGAQGIIKKPEEFIKRGEYYIDLKLKEETNPLLLIVEKPLKITKFILWVPTIGQLLKTFPELPIQQGGARESLSTLDHSYYVPNKGKTYDNYDEFLFARYMYNLHKMIWVEELDFKGIPTGKMQWYSESELLREKMGLEKKKDDDTDIRTITTYDEKGKPTGFQTERIRYDWDEGKVIVLEILERHEKKEE